MNRVSKAILIGLAGLVVIAVLLLLGINLYVQSPGTQARIQKELGKALKLPLVITNSSVTPWSDLRINGITVPSGDGKFFEATSFSARYRLLPILRKRLVIYDMRMESPKVVWNQNADGKWVLPALAEAPKNVAKKKKEPSKDDDFEVTLDGFQISNGSVELIDNAHKRVALFSNVSMRYTTLTAERVEGHLTIGHANYADGLFLENLRSTFEYANGQLKLPALEARWGGGSVAGSLTLSQEKRDSPFAAQLKFDSVDAARVSTDAGWKPGQIAGLLQGTLEAHGNSREIKKAEGKGSLALSNGHFRHLELFQMIGQVLQLEELANLQLKNASAEFRIGQQKAHVDSFLLEAPDLRLSAEGAIRFDGKVALDARLAINESLSNKLPRFLRESFSDPDPSGLPAIAFKISGKTDHPKTDLAEKLVGKKLGDQFENLVSGLFGTKKKNDEEKEEEKKKDDKKKDEKKKKKKKEEQEAKEAKEAPSGDAPEAGASPVLDVPGVPDSTVRP